MTFIFDRCRRSPAVVTHQQNMNVIKRIEQIFLYDRNFAYGEINEGGFSNPDSRSRSPLLGCIDSVNTHTENDNAWWRHQLETFSVLLAICAGNSLVPGEFPAQRPVTRSFDVFFDLHPNKRLSKQCWGWWFETPSCPLWRHRNGHRGGYKVIKSTNIPRVLTKHQYSLLSNSSSTLKCCVNKSLKC